MAKFLISFPSTANGVLIARYMRAGEVRTGSFETIE